MFKCVIEQDKYNNNQKKYFLTQGDSCVIYATPYKNGQPLDVELVEKCKFKLSDLEYAQEFEKEMPLEGDKFVLRLTSEETKKFAVASHIYEIEYTLIGGAVQTPNQWKFVITEQITVE